MEEGYPQQQKILNFSSSNINTKIDHQGSKYKCGQFSKYLLSPVLVSASEGSMAWSLFYLVVGGIFCRSRLSSKLSDFCGKTGHASMLRTSTSTHHMPAKSAHHIRGPDDIKELNIAGGDIFRENMRKNIRGFVIDDFIFTSGKN